MERQGEYLTLDNLKVYQLSLIYSKEAWEIYEKLSMPLKIAIGSQHIRSTDSVGANIAEGYGRFHYLDKIKFYYNARASLAESCDHWLELLKERDKIKDTNYQKIQRIKEKLSLKLNNFIASNYKTKINK